MAKTPEVPTQKLIGLALQLLPILTLYLEAASTQLSETKKRQKGGR